MRRFTLTPRRQAPGAKSALAAIRLMPGIRVVARANGGLVIEAAARIAAEIAQSHGQSVIVEATN